MKRAWPILVLIATLAVAGLCDVSRATARPETPRADHVTIVLAPYLTWADVTATTTPNLWRMAEQGAVGVVNSRARFRDSVEPASPIEAALGLSAGAGAQPDFSALAAYNATETVAGSQTAEEVYRHVFGGGMDGAHLTYLGLPATQELNDTYAPGVVLGSLGQAVRDANGLTAAVGNSDSGLADAGQTRALRPAAVVATDLRGLVRFGDVSTDLLKTSPEAPYGVATDLQRFAKVYASADEYAQGHKGPSLVVLDPGDLTRAHRFGAQATPDVRRAQWSAALSSFDAVVGMAEERTGANDVVIVVSQALYSSQAGSPRRTRARGRFR